MKQLSPSVLAWHLPHAAAREQAVKLGLAREVSGQPFANVFTIIAYLYLVADADARVGRPLDVTSFDWTVQKACGCARWYLVIVDGQVYKTTGELFAVANHLLTLTASHN